MVALVMAIMTGLWWLLDTEAGLRFVLTKAQMATYGALSVRQVHGRMHGVIILNGVHYNAAPDRAISIDTLHLRLHLWPLLHRELYVSRLNAYGVHIALPPSQGKSVNTANLSLQPPLTLRLEQVQLNRVQVTQGRQSLWHARQISLAASWHHTHLTLRKFKLDSHVVQLQLSGQIVTKDHYPGQVSGNFDWQHHNNHYAGTLGIQNDGQLAHVQLELRAPIAATLNLKVTQTRHWPWRMRLKVPAFATGHSRIRQLGATLAGRGDRQGGTLSGNLDINRHRFHIAALTAHLDPTYRMLQLEHLHLTSASFTGSLDARGMLKLDKDPIRGQLDIDWTQILLPARLVAQKLMSRGHLRISGSHKHHHIQGQLAIGPPGKFSNVTFSLEHAHSNIRLHSLKIRQAQGELDLHGELDRQTIPTWQFQVHARQFDPGQLFKDWHGALNLALDTQGKLDWQHPDIIVKLTHLGGHLRHHTLHGQGMLHLSARKQLQGTLRLQLGENRLRVDAMRSTDNPIHLNFNVTELHDWIPEIVGKMNGNVDVQGHWPALTGHAQLHAKGLGWQQYHVGNIQVMAHLSNLQQYGGTLTLDAQQLRFHNIDFKKIELHASGNKRQHQLRLALHNPAFAVQLALHGSRHDAHWQGTLTRLQVQTPPKLTWQLQQPAQMSWRQGRMRLTDTCLQAGQAQLCAHASGQISGPTQLYYRMHALPVAMVLELSHLLEPSIHAEGNLNGHGELQRSTHDQFSSKVDIASPHGAIRYSDAPRQVGLSYSALHLKANVTPTSSSLQLAAHLNQHGSLNAQFKLSGAQKTLTGQLNTQMTELGVVGMFSHSLTHVQGRLDTQLKFHGTLARPMLTGQARLTHFSANLPDVGITLNHGMLALDSHLGKPSQIIGRVQSGRGTLRLKGTLNTYDHAKSALLHIKAHAFNLVDTPSAQVVVSPNLALKHDASGIHVGGDIYIDEAHFNLDTLNGNGTARASSDVVIVDQSTSPISLPIPPLSATVKLHLGPRTQVIGSGLKARLGGTLTLTSKPGKQLTAQGTVSVHGTYQRYDQIFDIESGQLLFAQSTLDNPTLNIKAARRLKPYISTYQTQQESKLLLTGTAQKPRLTVFSNNGLSSPNALSYLVTGQTQLPATKTPAGIVIAAAKMIGSTIGNLLAKSIGTKVGLNLNIAQNQALNGDTAVTVGTYLTPKLYLSYGVSLFNPGQVATLSTRLSKHWKLELESTQSFNRASLNYRVEK